MDYDGVYQTVAVEPVVAREQVELPGQQQVAATRTPDDQNIHTDMHDSLDF